jgi:outer membrane receptor protein involved in Fe transport
VSLRVLSVVGVCFASTAAFAQSTETPPLEAETTAPSGAGSSAPPEPTANGAPPPDPHATAPQAESPAGQAAPLPEAAAPASGEQATPDADATELAPVVVNPDAAKKRVAQAKPRATSAGALTAPTFEPSQDLSVTPFSALTAEESSAISYTVSEAGVATKFDLPPREIPQTVVVTTQKLIKDFNLTDVKQILQFTPGIYVENERNVGSYQYFSRGYQLQVQFDGVPSAVRIGDRDAISLDSAMIDRVEVLQGAAGLLTGAGAPGGTINIVRKMPAKTQGGYVEATAGPWDGGRLVADVSTPIDASGKVRAPARGGLQLQRLLHRLRVQQAGHVLRRSAGRPHADDAPHCRRKRQRLGWLERRRLRQSHRS